MHRRNVIHDSSSQELKSKGEEGREEGKAQIQNLQIGRGEFDGLTKREYVQYFHENFDTKDLQNDMQHTIGYIKNTRQD